MTLTRRALLAGTAVSATVPFLGTIPARASAPVAGKQAPGVYRYNVGSFECTSINDGARTFPLPDNWVKNASKDEALAASDAAYFPQGKVTVPFNPQIINNGSKLVLIDTGNG